MDELVEAVKNLKINNTEYYESNTATVRDTQGDFISDPETVTHTINIIFEQTLLSCRAIHISNPPTTPGIAAIILTPLTFLMPATKDIFTDAASGGAWRSRAPWQVSRKGVYGSTPGSIDNVFDIIETSYPYLIGIDLPCGLNLTQEVGNKRKPTPPGLVR